MNTAHNIAGVQISGAKVKGSITSWSALIESPESRKFVVPSAEASICISFLRDILQQWSYSPTGATLEKLWAEVAQNSAVERCKKRLTGFQELSDGWYDGDGTAPSDVALAMAVFLLEQKPLLAPSVSVFPAVEGGVLFEFKVKGWDYSIEINNQGELEFLGVNLDGPGETGPRTFTGANSIKDLLEHLREEGV